MNAKEYLSQIQNLNGYIGIRCRNHEILKAAAERTTSVLSDMPRPSSRDPHRGEAKRVAVIDDAYEINELTDKYIDLLREAADKIYAIEDNNSGMKEVLEMKYIYNKGWDEIAEEMDLTERHVKRLHGWGLAAMDKIMDDES